MEEAEMEEAKALAQQHLLLQQQQQQQQLLLFRQLQKQQQQQQAISRFPSSIDAHLRPPGLQHRSIPNQQQQQQRPNPNPSPNPNPNPNSIPNQHHQQHQNPTTSSNHHHQQQQQQQKAIRPQSNQPELQMAYQDAWRVCHPDFKRPFSSLEDASERFPSVSIKFPFGAP